MTDQLKEYLRNDSCRADSDMEELLLDDSVSEEVDALLLELWDAEVAPISHIDKTAILNKIKAKAGNSPQTNSLNNAQIKRKIANKPLLIKRAIAPLAAAVFIGVVLATLWIYRSQESQEQIAVIQSSSPEVEVTAAAIEKPATINQPQPTEIVPSEVRINVPEGQTQELDFICGSTVKVEGGSNMVYDENFTGDTRLVSLDGRAHFSVVKHEKPFVVDNININLKVLGTEFYIDNRTSIDVITVRVDRGHVVITTLTGTETNLYGGDDIVIMSRKPNEI